MGLTEWLKVLFLDHRITFTWNAVKQNLLNILLFVPFGILLPVTINKFVLLNRTLICGLLFSFVIEYIQFITRLGIADIDDIVNNSLGVLVGWMCYKCFFAKGNKVDPSAL